MFLGHCTDEQLKIWEVNLETHYKGCSLIKAGVKCSEIAQELNDFLASKGSEYLQYRTFGYGHSFGALCHYYGREAGLELREDVETVLQPGMIVSMEVSVQEIVWNKEKFILFHFSPCSPWPTMERKSGTENTTF